MARYTGPKYKIARREKTNILEKESPFLEKRLNILPGARGSRGARRSSGYGLQLREKQKAKRIYGVLERQFRRYFDRATKEKRATGETLLRILETRLDNCLYRLRLAKSRTQARQLVSHGHILVDGKNVNIPSYQVKKDQIVELSEKARKLPGIKDLIEEKSPKLPGWLERKAAVGRIKEMPGRDKIDTNINEELIVEFYSR